MITSLNYRTKLDIIRRTDLPLLNKWRNSPEINKWTRQNTLINMESHEAWFNKMTMDQTMRMFLIRAESNEAIGVCGLTSIDLINQHAEFSLYIGPEHHGHGYGKDSLRLLCTHGFNAFPLRTIWGETFEGNKAALMFESLGFKRDGVRRDFYYRDGKFIDSIMYSIKSDELIMPEKNIPADISFQEFRQ